MAYDIKSIDDLLQYVFLKYMKKTYNPLDIELEYSKIIINNTIDEVIQTLFHLEKYNLGAINELKTYKFRTNYINKQEEFEILNSFIQKHLIDLGEIYTLCYDFLAVPLIIERKKVIVEEI